jgi:hypothetical protein
MSKQMTNWFPAHIKPGRKGVYQVTLWRNQVGYAYWNGKVWSWFDSERISDKEFLEDIEDGNTHDELKWRGLTEPQK